MKARLALLVTIAALAAMFGGVIAPAHAGTTYNSQSAFDTDNPGLFVEDFEGANVGAGSVATCASPVSAPSSCFATLQSGPVWTTTGEAGDPSIAIVMAGGGFIGNPTKDIGANYFVDRFEADFPGGVDSVGFDVIDYDAFGSGMCNIHVEDGAGNTLTDESNYPCNSAGSNFWGYTTSGAAIGKVIIDDPTGWGFSPGAEGMDNVRFGSASALEAHPAVLDTTSGPTLQLSATLTSKASGAPIVGKTVDFSAGSYTCSGVTDATGLAACGLVEGAVNALLNGGTYDANFAGSYPYTGSSSSAGLVA